MSTNIPLFDLDHTVELEQILTPSMHIVFTSDAQFTIFLNGVARTLKKITHTKGRLLDQAKILFNCVPFQMGTSLKGKNLLLEGVNSFLYGQFLIVWKINFITLSDLP